MIHLSSKRLSIILLFSLSLVSICSAKDAKQPEPYSLATNLSILLENKGKQLFKREPIVFENLDHSAANTILHRPQNTESITWLPNKEAEKGFVSRQQGIVVRSGRTLSFQSPAKPIKFTNTYKPEGKDHEGDSTEYLYADPLAASGYHMVEAEYMHDSPGMYFLNPNNRSLLYAHIGDHSVFLSRSNRLLVINNSSNPPFGLVITALSEQGHNVELYCLERDSKSSNLRFKGWYDNAGFDLVFQSHAPIPIQLVQAAGKWHIFTPENYVKPLTSKLTCWQQADAPNGSINSDWLTVR